METLRLKNYRKFEDTGEINLKPLTLLIGANSSGKSSFLKFFPLVKQTIRRHPNGVFLWYSDDVDFKDFDNTVKNGKNEIEINFTVIEKVGKTTNKINVSLTIAKQDEKTDFLKRLDLKVNDIEISVHFPVRSPRASRVRIFINGRSYEFDKCYLSNDHTIIPNILFRAGDKGFLSEIPFEVRDYLRSILKLEDESVTWQFREAYHNRDLIRKNIEKIMSKKSLDDIENIDHLMDNVILIGINRYLDSINSYFGSLANNITYIQPLRASAERYYRIQNIAIDEIDSHGDNLAMFLYSLDEDKKTELSDWLFDLFKFKLNIEPSGGHIEIQIEESPESGFKNLVDVGFGYSQTLPILASIWNSLRKKSRYRHYPFSIFRSQPNRFIVIEQPELHLHPRFITMFARMLILIISKYKDDGVKFIIETHSETLISQIGKCLYQNSEAEDKGISDEDISIVLFNAEKEGFSSNIHQTGYNSNGFLMEWPFGFFSGDILPDSFI